MSKTKTPTNDLLERRIQLGLSRAVLGKLTELTSPQIWRIEDGRPHGDEFAVVTAALDNVEKNGLPEHLRRTPAASNGSRPSQAELTNRIKTASALLDETVAAKTIRELRALIEQARAALTPAA